MDLEKSTRWCWSPGQMIARPGRKRKNKNTWKHGRDMSMKNMTHEEKKERQHDTALSS
jgi:hypothetical protein